MRGDFVVTARFMALATGAAVLLAGAFLAIWEAPRVFSNPTPVPVPSSGDVVQQWWQEQHSSASTLEKVLYTSELYVEMPLVNQYTRQLTLPDFLMVQGTPSQKYADGRMTVFYVSWKSWGDAWIHDFHYHPTILRCTLWRHKATVSILPAATEHMTASPAVLANFPGVVHRLTLQQDATGAWKVADDDYTDEFKQDVGSNVDWKKLIESLPGDIAREKSQAVTQPPPRSGLTNFTGSPGGPSNEATNASSR